MKASLLKQEGPSNYNLMKYDKSLWFFMVRAVGSPGHQLRSEHLV